MGDPMTESPSPAVDELLTTQAAGALVAAKVNLAAWPTDLAVVRPIHQGRTWPASTPTRANSVGARAIQRRPTSVEYRQWRQDLLPPDFPTDDPLRTGHDTDSYSSG